MARKYESGCLRTPADSEGSDRATGKGMTHVWRVPGQCFIFNPSDHAISVNYVFAERETQGGIV